MILRKPPKKQRKATATGDDLPAIIWQPIPNSSQALALDSRAQHTLFHGARGPGKTITQLMRFRRRVGLGYGAFWRGVIFDKEFKNLADLVAQSKRYFRKFKDGAKFLESASEYKWVWPTGEELLFRHAKKPEDYEDYHGHEYPFIGWNELTKYPTPDLYDKMCSCNRSSFRPEDYPVTRTDSDGKTYIEYLPPLPLEVFSTTNPSGPGHNWVKLRFINAAPNGVMVRVKVMVYDPKTKEDAEIERTQVAIFGHWSENPYLAAEYIAQLRQITNENLRRAWADGDWDVTAGGAFDDLWDSRTHILPAFTIPENWRVDRSFDWGSSHPFSVHWFAETNGEEVTLPDGRKFAPPAGTLIQFAEWYGAKQIGLNQGLKMSARDIAEGIKQREIAMLERGLISTTPRAGPADNQIRDVRESDVETIEKKMEDVGILWTSSDKSKGSRKNGFQLTRDRLEAAMRGEGPGIYWTTDCPAALAIFPTLARDDTDPDDVDTDQEEHVWDGIRYRVLASSNRLATTLTFGLPQ